MGVAQTATSTASRVFATATRGNSYPGAIGILTRALTARTTQKVREWVSRGLLAYVPDDAGLKMSNIQGRGMSRPLPPA